MILSNADAGVHGLIVSESEMEVGSAGGGFIVTGFPCGSSVSFIANIYICLSIYLLCKIHMSHLKV